MAVMYRPIVKEKGDKYEIEPYQSALNYAEVMQYAPLSIVLAAQVFFWSLGQQLLKAIPTFLETEMKKMSKKQQETLAEQLNLQNSGGGIQVYMNSLKGMLEDSMKLHDFPFINA
jgi:polyhydroxyalkanoate synthesis regulator protein